MTTESQLVDQAKQGNTHAFEQLVLRHQNRIYSLAVHMVQDRDEASDLAQEAFFKAWQNLPSFQGESSFSTWMHRLTTNLCLDYLRKQTRRQDIAATVSLDDEASGWSEPLDFQQDPHHQMEHLELRQTIRDALSQLPDHQRQVLVMRELSGMSYQEIAEQLDLDLGTVKSRIARARLSLRKILLQQGNFLTSGASNDTDD